LRIWHDDARVPPDSSWLWVRTNDEAKELLEKADAPPCTEISLDHDLGLHGLGIEETDDWDKIIEITYALAETVGEETGLDLVEWMIENDCVPPLITIHSWNPDGAMRMARRLADNGHDVLIRPYDPKRGR
jgi:hypothetical protein